jgi:hypothetical protein
MGSNLKREEEEEETLSDNTYSSGSIRKMSGRSFKSPIRK